MNRGLWYAIAAYVIWGFFPLYWKQLGAVPPSQQVAHRVIWSLLLLWCVVCFQNRGRTLFTTFGRPRVVWIYFGSALLLGTNWLVYLWAVSHGFVVEASLGYFINPLFSVVLGVVFFRERLRLAQWIAVGIALIGVLYLTFEYGSLPWIGLALAAAFGLYGLVRKAAPLDAVPGLTLEMGFLFVPALLFLFFAESQGHGAFFHAGLTTDLYLMGAGVATTVPLLLFIGAARRIPLSHLGIVQYITPTGQLLLGVLKYNEPFTCERAIGFAIIWTALIIFAVEGLVAQKSKLF